MDDDQKLKIILYSILTISIVVIIGIWEQIVQPLALFIINIVKSVNIG